jgi:transposase
LAPLSETAKLNGINPLAYLSDILNRLAQGHQINWIAELLSWRWSAASSTVWPRRRILTN